MRTTEQRFLDRFKNAGNMLTSGIGGSWRQATETNPNLNRWGNAADTVNGLVGMAGNVIGAAGEVIGVGDAVQGIGAGIDIATAAALDAANSAEADIRFADTAMGAEGAKNTVVRSIQGFADANPNAAEGMKAVVNMATAGYGVAKGVGTVNNMVATKRAESFFEGTRYTEKVRKQASSGDCHSFPQSVDGFSGAGKVSKIKGGDGISRQKLEIPGSYQGKDGVFEYIKETDGAINHRFFKQSKK